jgi:hypothetical protein
MLMPQPREEKEGEFSFFLIGKSFILNLLVWIEFICLV